MAKKNSFYRHKKAVSTKNGIRSRTRRGQFAQHWWSKRWIDFIERLAEPGRMQRGRTYARQGQVLDIDVQPGLIEARVQGSRRTPYQVRLYFDIIDRSVLPLLIERFNRRASIAAYLLAGQMPPELEALFEEQGARLFPEPHGHNRLFCSCPDDSDFCKHIAAVLYLVGEVFDQDPLLLLRLRGIGKEMILPDTNVALPDCTTEGGVDFLFDEELGAVTGGDDPAVPETESVALDYSFSGTPFEPMQPPSHRFSSRGALWLLQEFPFWRGEVPFRESMSDFYSKAMGFAQQIEAQEKE